MLNLNCVPTTNFVAYLSHNHLVCFGYKTTVILKKLQTRACVCWRENQNCFRKHKSEVSSNSMFCFKYCNKSKPISGEDLKLYAACFELYSSSFQSCKNELFRYDSPIHGCETRFHVKFTQQKLDMRGESSSRVKYVLACLK